MSPFESFDPRLAHGFTRCAGCGGSRALRFDSGAKYSHSFIPFTSHVEHDRELVTGQDPQSTEEFGEEFTKALIAQHAGR